MRSQGKQSRMKETRRGSAKPLTLVTLCWKRDVAARVPKTTTSHCRGWARDRIQNLHFSPSLV